MKQNCWQILGIEPTENQQSIRHAYRSKLPDYHPENDPSGFQLLRQAFEQARKLAESPFILRSAQHDSGTVDPDAHVIDGSVQLEVQGHEQLHSNAVIAAEEEQDQQLFDTMLAQFDSLLNSPEQRYHPQYWHRYIYQLNQHDIMLIDRLRWPLLERVYQSTCISRDCARLLAERFNWLQRLDELEYQQAEEMEEYLHYITQGDIFDFSTLSSISLPAQLETVSYFQQAHHFYWDKPIWMLRLLLTDPLVIYWPDCPRLMKQVARWYSLAEVPSESLRDYCLQQLALDSEDREWLYLAARHCSLIMDNEQAFGYWLRLYQLEQHAQAEQWLLNWCREQHIAYYPLLIQALDRPVYPPAAGMSVDDAQQTYLFPTRTVQTLVRWREAAQLNWTSIPIAREFIKWKSGSHIPIVMYSHLLLDDGTDPLRLLYRHASMLTIGGETLLQHIIDQPTPADPLQALILQGLQYQAKQRLAWLNDSSVIASFIHWLDGPPEQELPQMFTDTYSAAWQQVMVWLCQWRYLSSARLVRLYHCPTFISDLEPINDWLTFLAAVDHIEIPFIDATTATWDQYRQTCLLALLLNDAVGKIDAIRQLNNLPLSKQHPAYDLYQLIRQLDPDKGDLIWQLEEQLQLDNRLHYHCWIYSPVSLDQFLSRVQRQITVCSYFNVDRFYHDVASWQQEMAQAPFAEQAIYHALFLRHGNQTMQDKNRAALEQLNCSTQEEIDLQQALLNREEPRLKRHSTLFIRGSLLTKMMQASNRMYKDERAILDNDEQVLLTACLADNNSSKILRLNAGLLVEFSNNRQFDLKHEQDQYPVSHFWQFWRINSRINRLGLVAQLSLVSPAMILVYLPLQSVLSTWVIILSVLLNIFSALTRRGHDMNRTSPRYEALLSISMPFLIILHLLIPGVNYATKYGPPPGKKRRWRLR